MARSKKYPIKMTLKEVESKILRTFQDCKGNWIRSISKECVIHIMFADTMQRSSIQETTHESSITI